MTYKKNQFFLSSFSTFPPFSIKQVNDTRGRRLNEDKNKNVILNNLCPFIFLPSQTQVTSNY